MLPLLALWLWIEKRHLENECVTSSPYESPVTGAHGKKNILPHPWKMCAVEQYPLKDQECFGIQEHPFTIPRSIVNPWSWKCGLNPSLFLRRKRENDKFAVTRKWSLFQGWKLSKSRALSVVKALSGRVEKSEDERRRAIFIFPFSKSLRTLIRPAKLSSFLMSSSIAITLSLSPLPSL